MKYHRPAATPPVISWFDDFGGPNPYAFLSNFHIGAPLVHEGLPYATGEHLFAALKAATPEDRDAIRRTVGPAAAKTLGRTIELRADWEEIKYDAMALVLSLKFTLDRPEGQQLIATGNALLVEGTFWGDTVWGVTLGDNDRLPSWQQYGRNWLGRLLMARRAELVAEATFGVAPAFDALEHFVALPEVPDETEEYKESWLAFDGLTAEDLRHLNARDEPEPEPEFSGGFKPFKVAGRTPFCRIAYDGACVTPWHLHETAAPATCLHESWEEGPDGRPAKCADCGHDFARRAEVDAASAAVAPRQTPEGRLNHWGCDHGSSKNARARCRRRWLRENQKGN